MTQNPGAQADATPIAPQANSAPSIRALVGGALADMMNDLGPSFEQATGIHVEMRFAPTPQLIQLATSGAPFDLAIAPVDMMTNADALGCLVPAPVVDIARVGYSVAIRAGTPPPDISTVNSFRQTLLAARTLTFLPNSAAGSYVLKAFDRLGITEAMASKTIAQVAPKEIAGAVARGEADLGLFLTNVLMAPGVDIIGPFPSEVQHELVFAAAIARQAANVPSVHRFIAFLKSPHATTRIAAHGMIPG